MRDLRRITVEDWDNVDLQDLDELGQYATTNTGMYQCNRTCYWVLEVLVYSATFFFSGATAFGGPWPPSQNLSIYLFALHTSDLSMCVGFVTMDLTG